MDSKEIQELLKLVNRLELAEFKYKQGEVEFSVRTKYFNRSRSGYEMQAPSMPMQQPQQLPQNSNFQQPAQSGTSKQAQDHESNGNSSQPSASNKELVEIRSPIVGTFYRSATPDKPVYVKPGDPIELGTVVCIIEAMKLFNEIESEVAGKIVKILVEDASPVEYDQLLFLIDPS